MRVHAIQIGPELEVEATELGLPFLVLLILSFLEATHSIEMLAFLSIKPFLHLSQLSQEAVFLLLESLVPLGKFISMLGSQVSNLSPVSVLLCGKFVMVPLVKSCKFISFIAEMLVVLTLHI